MNQPTAQQKTFNKNRNGGQQRVISGLKKQVAELQKGQSGLQTTQEIKYLKGRITTLEKDRNTFSAQALRAAEALRKIGVPETLVVKLVHGEVVTGEDLPGTVTNINFNALLTPEEG